MAAIFSTLIRGLVHVGIATLVVALTWTVYIYRAPIASTIEPVTRQFQSAPLEPARATATVPAPQITPVVPTPAESASNPAPLVNSTKVD